MRLRRASANSEDALRPCRGWLTAMLGPLFRKFVALLGFFLFAVPFPRALRAQLVRENTAPRPQQVSASKETQISSSPKTPPGKRRLAQEVQLTGDESWIDTGIDVQAGEHVVITGTGKVRYADAKDDNGPEGLTRKANDALYSSAGLNAAHTALRPGGIRTYSNDYNDFTCCHGTGMETNTKHADSIYLHSGDTLYVNLFIPSVLSWPAAIVSLYKSSSVPSVLVEAASAKWSKRVVNGFFAGTGCIRQNVRPAPLLGGVGGGSVHGEPRRFLDRALGP